MKKCEYCSKEISYFEQYCCDECHNNARKFFNTTEKNRKLFSVFNIIGVVGLAIGLFWCVFQIGIGNIIAGSAAFVLGVLYFFLPFPTPDMIKKSQIKKAVKRVKTLGIIGIVIGLGLLIFGLIKTIF